MTPVQHLNELTRALSRRLPTQQSPQRIATGGPIELNPPLMRQVAVMLMLKDMILNQESIEKWAERMAEDFAQHIKSTEQYCELLLPKSCIEAHRAEIDNCIMRCIVDYIPGTDEKRVLFDVLVRP